MRRGFLTRKKSTPADSEMEAEGRRASMPAVGTDIWLCRPDDDDPTVSDDGNARLIGKVLAVVADRGNPGGTPLVRIDAGSEQLIVMPSHCRPCVVRHPGERVLTHAVRMRAWAVARLLGAVEWGGDADEDEASADEGSGSGAGRCSLPAELVDAIVGCLEVRPVSRVRVIALAASSIAANASIAHALDPSDNNWWISAPGSMPGGVGKESITFSLDAGTSPVVIDRVTMRIPPLPSGPLSVRVFHLEVFTGPHDLVGETWARAFTNPQMWARASRDFTTRDVSGDQAFAVYPPVEAAFVRVVCTRNAARARLSDDEYTELEGRWGDTLMLENIVPSSVGFFSVRFG